MLCGQPALGILHWPTGQRVHCCRRCLSAGVAVLAALGTDATVTYLASPRGVTCDQRITDPPPKPHNEP